MLTVRVYLTVFLIVTSTGRVLGKVIAYVTQYVPYHTLCKSQYMLTPLSRAWSVPITFNHNDMSVSTVRVVHRPSSFCVCLGDSLKVSLPASDHIHAVTWGMQGP